MKWFGIDYRYVIAAVGAVFILWYEGSAPVQEEPQAEQAKEKPQPTQSNIEALKGINDKLAELLKNHRDALEEGSGRFQIGFGQTFLSGEDFAEFFSGRKEVLRDVSFGADLRRNTVIL